LKVSFIRPHSPYDPPERFMRRYAEAELPAARVGKWAARYEARNSDRDDIWRGKLPDAEVRRSRQGYYGSISHVDEQIGRVLETLERRGMLEETLIVFTSDHGDMTGDQNLWRKSYPYEPSAHIPMRMRWPSGMLSGARGQTFAQPVELRDILPTFLDAASAPLQHQIDGRSLLSLVRNGGAGYRPRAQHLLRPGESLERVHGRPVEVHLPCEGRRGAVVRFAERPVRGPRSRRRSEAGGDAAAVARPSGRALPGARRAVLARGKARSAAAGNDDFTTFPEGVTTTLLDTVFTVAIIGM
jgi:hypothetical protein